jgi:hypothetical protein
VLQIGVWLGWVVALVFIEGTIFSAWVFYLPGREYNALLAAFYGAFHRITWSIGTSWLILAISTGNGGKTASALTRDCQKRFFRQSEIGAAGRKSRWRQREMGPCQHFGRGTRNELVSLPPIYFQSEFIEQTKCATIFYTQPLLWKSKARHSALWDCNVKMCSTFLVG